MAQEAMGKGGNGQKGSASAGSAFSLWLPSKQMGNLHDPPRLLLLAAYGGSGGIRGQSGLNTVLKPEVMCIRDHPLPCSSPRLTRCRACPTYQGRGRHHAYPSAVS